MVCFGSWFEDTVHHDRKAWEKEPEATTHVATVNRKRVEPLPAWSRTSAYGKGLSTVRVDQDNSAQTRLQTCFHGDSKAQRDDEISSARDDHPAPGLCTWVVDGAFYSRGVGWGEDQIWTEHHEHGLEHVKFNGRNEFAPKNALMNNDSSLKNKQSWANFMINYNKLGWRI